MKKINYNNISTIKISLQELLMGQKVYNQMISFQALEFKRYLNSWFENPDISWEEFSAKDNSFQSFLKNEEIDLSTLDSISESFYYKDYDKQKVFNLLKDLNSLEKQIKQIEKQKSEDSTTLKKAV